jgi:hypothetical protein
VFRTHYVRGYKHIHIADILRFYHAIGRSLTQTCICLRLHGYECTRNAEERHLNGKHQFIVYADTVNFVDVQTTHNEKNRNTIETL